MRNRIINALSDILGYVIIVAILLMFAYGIGGGMASIGNHINN